MKSIPLSTKSVGEVVDQNARFFIPSYQRGYRWDREQVEALLNDLAEFEKDLSLRQFYCLQPLVVVRRDDAWEVVDGQQRLTTIFLILKHLSPPGTPLFHIRYERHPEVENGLHGLLAKRPDFDSPDLHFIREAEKVIREWVQENDVTTLSSLTNRDGACAKFIWHEIEHRQEAIKAFMRLNAGKIRLKDSELIRALFLQTDASDETARHRIALRWDHMERRLQDPEFWSFLNRKEEAPDSRIEFLFRSIFLEKKKAITKEREVFDHFFAELTKSADSDQRAQLWQDVEDHFDTWEEWFEDNRLFHLVGFLIELGEKLSHIYSAAREKNRSAFTNFLKERIRALILSGVDSSDDIPDLLARLEYGDSTIKNLLLCLNLATLDADETGTVRFSFHAYKNEDWDIEHIRATATHSPESLDEFKAALEATRRFGKRCGPSLKEEIKELLAEIPADLDDQSPEWLAQLYDSLRDTIEGRDVLGASNGIENLTLLDAATNRGYGNSFFAVKRAWVLGLDQQAKYLLPCTRNVFTKAYSKSPVNLMYWTPEDAADYRAAITSTLTRFFATTWKANT